MRLSRYTLKNINPDVVVVPDEEIFELPEKVLQFGTGVLLRGLPDYYIDKANCEGVFNGRIVMVKSSDHTDTSAFDKQDGLYTICIRGLENGEKVEENIINASVSRVISANEQWDQILSCARDENMQIIISNTTEVGIQLVNDDIRRLPPASFPGKLLAFLYERFKAFNGSAKSGMVIVPTELVVNNGKKLESIVLELAHLNSLEEEFIEWLEQSNHFCNSLVDRIVPSKPDAELQALLEEELGYADQFLTVSEAYGIWAIEGNEHVKNILSFAQVNEGVVIEPNIELHRELKLRLLNGTHTISCGLAFLAGFETVKQAMDDEDMSTYIRNVMLTELAPAIPYKVDKKVAKEFGNKVLNRFQNPHIRHQWIDIAMQLSSKLKNRDIPMLLKYYELYDTVPELFSLGIAAYLYFTKPVKEVNNKYYGALNGVEYPIQDDLASLFMKRWNNLEPSALVKEVLADTLMWGKDLTMLPGFCEAVTEKLNRIIEKGAKAVVESEQLKKVLA